MMKKISVAIVLSVIMLSVGLVLNFKSVECVHSHESHENCAELAQEFSDSEISLMRNVAGEIKGAEKVFSFCVEMGIKSVELFYDYEGIEKWCTGEWKRNREGTVSYYEMYQSIKDVLSVKFTKVKGHSGNKYNDEVDALAKSVLGIK